MRILQIYWLDHVYFAATLGVLIEIVDDGGLWNHSGTPNSGMVADVLVIFPVSKRVYNETQLLTEQPSIVLTNTSYVFVKTIIFIFLYHFFG